eukprot:TRINITY_DN26763_c0_g1_i1.p2 TRINITY_DN26763_c0_g1~~TRINITY_DN26763_c0_g1_i1.p2  ORF type:complete len:258 (+),score=31.42 TRINITY_DN26763_c0_g1_i1:29-775(+)
MEAELKELQDFRAQAKTARVKRLLANEICAVKALIAQQKEGQAPSPTTTSAPPPTQTVTSEPKPAQPKQQPQQPPAATPVAVSAVASNKRAVAQTISTYGWDQSAISAKVYFAIKNAGCELKSEYCQLECTPKTCIVHIDIPNPEKAYMLSLGPLGGEILPNDCAVKAKPDGSVTVTLKKAKKGNSWQELVSKAPKKTPKFEKDEDPSAGLMKMVQGLYEDGDDEMKRTISKAFYESRQGKTPDIGAI